MKKLVFFAVLMMGFSIMAVAQDVPAVEVFGGYSYLRVNPPSDMEDADAVSMNGWDASVAINGNRWLGFVADFGGYYDSSSVDFGEESYDQDVRIHSIMFGPRFAIRQGKVTPFAHALFGYARLTSDVEGEEVLHENDFAMAFGGGVDINVNDRIAVRPVQVDYLAVKYGLTGDFLNNFRYSAGIVFKFGSR